MIKFRRYFSRGYSNRIFGSKIKYVIVFPCGLLVPCVSKPSSIPGGYITRNGRRYIHTLGVRLIPNLWVYL